MFSAAKSARLAKNALRNTKTIRKIYWAIQAAA
jgi:hypothetical protein